MGSLGNDDPVARGILNDRFCCRFLFWFLPVGFRPARTRAMQAFVAGSMEAPRDSFHGRKHFFNNNDNDEQRTTRNSNNKRNAI